MPLYFGFVDLKKAFDSIYKHSIIEALKAGGIENTCTDILTNIHNLATANVRLNNVTPTLPILKGARQEDTIPPRLLQQHWSVR